MPTHSRVRMLTTGPVVRLTENDMNMDADGGRVVLIADVNDPNKGPVDLVEGEEKLGRVTCVLNYRRDDPMAKWPVGREDRARRRFIITIEEWVEVESASNSDESE